jgi:membrane-associated phospholipid phosphatase
MQRFTWAFFALNVAGFVTYHLYPAAPPWYLHAHGCAVDLAAHASPGDALARVDAMTGVPYFAGMYGRASDVVGAMPSLHVAYPLLIVLAGWRVLGWPGRAAALGFLASMCFAAIYLDHHWISDEIVGLTFGAVAFTLVGLAFQRNAPEPQALPLGGAA